MLVTENCSKMRQHGNYVDSGVNPMMAAQMHHMAAQRSQHNPGVNQFPGREGSLRAEDERQYIPKAEGQWQWDREASKPSNSLPSHVLDEGKFLFCHLILLSMHNSYCSLLTFTSFLASLLILLAIYFQEICSCSK